MIIAVLVILATVSALFVYLKSDQGTDTILTYHEPEQAPSITILWAKWKPADYFQRLVDEFTAETGIHVKIVQHPWKDIQRHLFSEMEIKSQRYDMVIGDSQWLGYGSKNGHYINLTRWIEQHHVNDRFIQTAMSNYAEYPKASNRYWAIPLECDAMGFAYRKDLFEDNQEKRAFLQRYGYTLDIPETWSQLKDIAEFFNRPKEDFWGLLAWRTTHYDGLTMAIQPLIWAWGADLGNKQTFQIRGILNNAAATSALAFYKQLAAFQNPEWKNYYLDSGRSSHKPLIDGQVAMSMVYFATSAELTSPANNTLANNIGFFAAPAGPVSRATSLGGQGISIISYSKKKAYSFRLLKWLLRPQVQERWSELGGLSCGTHVLNSKKLLTTSPMHKAFSESLTFAQDYWAVPEYAELLALSQQHWDKYLSTDDISAKDSLDNLTTDWENLFEYHGYYKE